VEVLQNSAEGIQGWVDPSLEAVGVAHIAEEQSLDWDLAFPVVGLPWEIWVAWQHPLAT
jgi:hypothetical protein